MALAHPSSREQVVGIPLSRLEGVESARILLLGWIALHWDGAQMLLSYNRRTSEPVDRFLSTLRMALLTSHSGPLQQPRLSFGDELDLVPGTASTSRMFPVGKPEAALAGCKFNPPRPESSARFR